MEFFSPNPPSKEPKPNQTQTLRDVWFQSFSNHSLPSLSNLLSTTCPRYQQSFHQILTGTLQKKTLNSRWQSRYFVLTPLRLLYFADEERSELKGCFSLVSLKQHHLEITSCFPDITFKITFTCQDAVISKNILLLQILDEEQFSSWSQTLLNALNDIDPQHYNLSAFPSLKVDSLMQSNQKICKSNYNFWNTLTISKAELLNYVSHLDIIFLRSKSAFSSVHRFLTGSYYDHVGVLLKDEQERAYLLQAIHDTGVTISRLENLFQSFHQEYQEMGCRKLLTSPHKALPLERLQSYINHLIGKKYQLSITKLLIGNENDSDNSGDQANEQSREKNEKTYFCSELIADIYLKFGVLIQGKSHFYWPKDFEQTFLPLSSGFYLSPLMKVQLPVDELQRSILQE